MRWVAPIAVLVAAGAVAGATAAPNSVTLIRPAQGIGKITLGMSEVELRGAISGGPRNVALVALQDWPRRARVLEVGVAVGR